MPLSHLSPLKGSVAAPRGMGDGHPPPPPQLSQRLTFQFVEIRTENGRGGGGGVTNEVVKCKITFAYISLYWIKMLCSVTLLRPPFMRFQLQHVELEKYLFLKPCSVSISNV